MATNSYFDSNYGLNGETCEQDLVEDLIIESIQIYGRDCLYIPRDLVERDDLFDEGKISSFDRTYEIELYLKNVDSFAGDRDFLSRFGLEIRDEVSFTVAKKRFQEVIVPGESSETELSRPREGDLIYFPLDKRTFEISFVEGEEVFYQLGKLYTYELRCRVFEMGNESFDTGEAEIDAFNDYEQNVILSLSDGSGDYTIGEIVTAGAASAVVKDWGSIDSKITLEDVAGDIDVVPPLTGQTSGASYSTVVVDTELANDQLADNYVIDDEAQDIVDFSESNPFSE